MTVPVTGHTCSMTLMAMTETRERLEVAAPAVPLPLGDVGHPSSEEVSLSICATEVTPPRGHTSPTTQSMCIQEKMLTATCCTCVITRIYNCAFNLQLFNQCHYRHSSS